MYSILFYNGPILYFATEEDLMDTVNQLLTEGDWGEECGRFCIEVSSAGTQKKYYSAHITKPTVKIIMRWIRLWNTAQKLAQEKIWGFAWAVSGEPYKRAAILRQMEEAKTIIHSTPV